MTDLGNMRAAAAALGNCMHLGNAGIVLLVALSCVRLQWGGNIIILHDFIIPYHTILYYTTVGNGYKIVAPPLDPGSFLN